MVKEEINTRIVKEHTSSGEYKLMFYSDGIVEINFSQEIGEVQISHIKDIVNRIGEYGGGKLMPVYITLFPFTNISIEAKEYVSSAEGLRFTLANAVLVDNLAKKCFLIFM